LFSTITGVPSASAMPLEIARAVMSMLPPGAKGTTILIARSG
jgi:hypothetical protein